ncbi:MAG: dienelactone hydrolase family protein [Cyanophyceae cyanobacterium]
MSPKKAIALFCLTAILIATVFAKASPSKDITTRMAVAHRHDRPMPTAIAQAEPTVPVTAQQVEYATVGGQTVTGYLAQPESGTELPGLIAIHEWWGLNENIEAMARRLAGEGYQVLAVDLYSGQTAQTPEAARELMQAVMQNPLPARDNLQQAYEYLTQQDASNIGVIGWCFGGGWALETALAMPDKLDAAVIYYGRLVTVPAELAVLDAPILGIFGAEDQSIPVEQVRDFEQALNSLDKTAEIHIYEGAGHAFANPSGDRYVPEAAAAAWQETIQFLNKYLAAY